MDEEYEDNFESYSPTSLNQNKSEEEKNSSLGKDIDELDDYYNEDEYEKDTSGIINMYLIYFFEGKSHKNLKLDD